MVRKVGLEPTRPFGHRILNPMRLPVPPLAHIVLSQHFNPHPPEVLFAKGHYGLALLVHKERVELSNTGF